jgi:hypothetical protein
MPASTPPVMVKVVLVRDPFTYEETAYRMAHFLDFFQPTPAPPTCVRWTEAAIPKARADLQRLYDAEGVGCLRHGRLPIV